MAYTEKITFDIDLTKVDKEKLNKGKYLKMTIVPTPSSPYNEYMISQYMGAGESGNIIGNGDDLQTVLDKIGGDKPPMKLDESSTNGLPF
jgi:hypothetical protein